LCPQQTVAARMVEGARLADRFGKRLGQQHAVWGDGALGGGCAGRGRAKLPCPVRPPGRHCRQCCRHC
jgi:hypothetical protein